MKSQTSGYKSRTKIKRACAQLIVFTAVLVVFFSDLKGQTSYNPTQTKNCIFGEIPERFAYKLEAIVEAENRLCREIKTDPSLKAIYGFSLSPTRGKIVRIYDDKAVYTNYEDDARYWELRLGDGELTELKSAISKIDIETQGPAIEYCVDACTQYEFLNIQKNAGRRTFIFAQWTRAPLPMRSLGELFTKWDSYSAITTRYYLEEKLPESRVLIGGHRYSVRSVWNAGTDLRVLVFDKGQPLNEGPFWHLLADGKIGEKVKQPAEVQFLKNYSHPGCGRLMGFNYYAFQMQLGGDEICYGVSEKAGLWKVGAKETKLQTGEYSSPLVTRDQKWIVAAKGDAERPIWKSIVRINALTGKEYKIDIPVADCFYPAGSVPITNQVLLVRCKHDYTEKKNNPSPDPPEHFLLDPETGKATLTKNEIRPIMHQQFRYLQPKTNPNEFWAAIPDSVQNTTEIGHYNPSEQKFTPIMTIPSIVFYSNDFWVDERENILYIVYEFQLLRLPLHTRRDHKN